MPVNDLPDYSAFTVVCIVLRLRLGTHYPCSRAVDTAVNMDRKHECHSGHPYLRAVFVIRAITGVLQVENNYDLIISSVLAKSIVVQSFLPTRPVDTGAISVLTTRVHGPCRWAVFTSSVDRRPCTRPVKTGVRNNTCVGHLCSWPVNMAYQHGQCTPSLSSICD